MAGTTSRAADRQHRTRRPHRAGGHHHALRDAVPPIGGAISGCTVYRTAQTPSANRPTVHRACHSRHHSGCTVPRAADRRHRSPCRNRAGDCRLHSCPAPHCWPWPAHHPPAPSGRRHHHRPCDRRAGQGGPASCLRDTVPAIAGTVPARHRARPLPGTVPRASHRRHHSGRHRMPPPAIAGGGPSAGPIGPAAHQDVSQGCVSLWGFFGYGEIRSAGTRSMGTWSAGNLAHGGFEIWGLAACVGLDRMGNGTRQSGLLRPLRGLKQAPKAYGEPWVLALSCAWGRYWGRDRSMGEPEVWGTAGLWRFLRHENGMGPPAGRAETCGTLQKQRGRTRVNLLAPAAFVKTRRSPVDAIG